MYVAKEIYVKKSPNSKEVLDYPVVHPVLQEYWLRVPAILLFSNFQPTKRRWFITVRTIGTVSPFVKRFLWGLKEIDKREIIIYVPFRDLNFIKKQVEAMTQKGGLKEVSQDRNGHYFILLDKEALNGVVSAIFGQSIRYAIFFISAKKIPEAKSVSTNVSKYLKSADIIARDIDGEAVHLLLVSINHDAVQRILADAAKEFDVVLKEHQEFL
jgi:hypothetical protein